MAIALPLIAQLFEPVQHMVHWLAGGEPVSSRGQERPCQPSDRPVRLQTHRQSLPLARAPGTGRPLRVIRVVEGRAAPGPRDAGRMVISGRMADVCAELERLAALEARAGT